MTITTVFNNLSRNTESLPEKIEPVTYEYHHAPVPGGGFVTGFCFHPVKKDILYARTDIGGVYRYDFTSKTWSSLMDHVTDIGKWESYPLSIALDPVHPDWLYIVSGDWTNNYLCRSKDRGEHFEYFILPAGVHGNASGRGTGERLIVDPVNPCILYFGSQTEGLLVSNDYGEHWQPLSVCLQGGKIETDIAFVWLDPRSSREGRCQTLVVSTSGKDNSPGGMVRGSSLYLSKDAGKSFTIMPGQPVIRDYGNYPGFVGQRAAFTEPYLYVTLAAVGFSWNGWQGYACDMGGSQKGCIIRYQLSEFGDITEYRYVTPDLKTGGSESVCSTNLCDISGFGGIDVDRRYPGHLICSTQGCEMEETVFYSSDYGEHWFPVLQGLDIGRMDFTEVPYMKPEYNDNKSLIHWLSDIKLDPFASDRAVFNTGTGSFMTENLQDCLSGKPVIWKPSCTGLEETVHLNIYSPPAGEVQLIDIVGDLGGFAFSDLSKPAENSFADENNHRYITCLNADFPDRKPELVAVTARGNWKGKTTGGVIWSENQCKTWRRLPDPIGLTGKIDRLIDRIHKPNTNAGWVAISADAKTLVWSVADDMLLPIDAVVYTEDLGKSWKQCMIYDLQGKQINCSPKELLIRVEQHSLEDSTFQEKEEPLTLKVLSDRVDPELFYGFGKDSRMYISTDRAHTFYELSVPDAFPRLELGGVDTIMPAEIRAEAEKEGTIFLATGEGGLWKMIFSKKDRTAEFIRISGEGDIIYRQGMGKSAPGSKYKTLYVNGVIRGEYGFYRSFDEGQTWQRINLERQMFGDIRSITGDPRTFERIYVATGSRGVLWGEPVNLINKGKEN